MREQPATTSRRHSRDSGLHLQDCKRERHRRREARAPRTARVNPVSFLSDRLTSLDPRFRGDDSRCFEVTGAPA